MMQYVMNTINMLFRHISYVKLIFMSTIINIEKLKEIIDDTHLSVAAVERKAGLKRNVLQNILYGKSKAPNSSTINAITKALNCKLQEIMESEDTEDWVSWDKDLFLGIVSKVCEELDKDSLSTNYNFILLMVDECYRYCIESSSKHVDDSFVKWLIKKNK